MTQFSRRSVLRGAGLIAAGTTAASVLPLNMAYGLPRRAAGVVAGDVSSFLASLGVCTHIGQGVDDAARVAEVLSYLGVFDIRDDAHQDAVPNWIDLHRACGGRVNLIAQSDSVDDTIAMARDLAAAGALMSIEGPNEPNNQPVTYQGQTSGRDTTFLPVARFMRDLYAQVRDDDQLSRYPVFHSSEAGGSEPDNVGLQFLTIPPGQQTLLPAGTRYADYANTHTYPDRAPGWSDNLAQNVSNPTLHGAWDGLYDEYGLTWNKHFPGYPDGLLRELPRVMTETGWATEGDGSISERDQAGLLISLYLANFQQQWRNTFIYMLRDDPVQGYWGLVDSNYQPKRSGLALHNLTTILRTAAAPGGPQRPGGYSISGDTETTHHMRLQDGKNNYLVVWNEQANGSTTLTVQFNDYKGVVSVYDPLTSTEPVEEAGPIQLSMDGYDCRIIRI